MRSLSLLNVFTPLEAFMFLALEQRVGGKIAKSPPDSWPEVSLRYAIAYNVVNNTI